MYYYAQLDYQVSVVEKSLEKACPIYEQMNDVSEAYRNIGREAVLQLTEDNGELLEALMVILIKVKKLRNVNQPREPSESAILDSNSKRMI